MKMPPYDPKKRGLYTPHEKKGEWEQFCDDCKLIIKVVFYPIISLVIWINKLFLNLDCIFGNADYTNYSPKQRIAIPLSEIQRNCEHEWLWDWNQRQNWFMTVGGKPSGTYFDLNDSIRLKQQKPDHNETELCKLQEWHKAGYDIVFRSFNRYHCKKCNSVYTKEFYTNPYWKRLCDSLYLPQKNLTQPIPVISYNRREIAVEPVKIYVN